jgi:hypothetical protein
MKINTRKDDTRAEREEYLDTTATNNHVQTNIKPQKKL